MKDHVLYVLVYLYRRESDPEDSSWRNFVRTFYAQDDHDAKVIGGCIAHQYRELENEDPIRQNGSALFCQRAIHCMPTEQEVSDFREIGYDVDADGYLVKLEPAKV